MRAELRRSADKIIKGAFRLRIKQRYVGTIVQQILCHLILPFLQRIHQSGALPVANAVIIRIMDAVPIVRPMIYVGTRGKQNPDTFEIAVLCRRLQRRLAEIVRFVDVGLLPLLPQSDKPAQIFGIRDAQIQQFHRRNVVRKPLFYLHPRCPRQQKIVHVVRRNSLKVLR